jgi:predicted nucleic acid-binding protein
MPDVISNTSPLQYLHQAELLSLLPAMYGTLTIPVAVADEIERGIELGIALPRVGELPWRRVRAVRHGQILPIVTELDAGDREVLRTCQRAVQPPKSVLTHPGCAMRKSL